MLDTPHPYKVGDEVVEVHYNRGRGGAQLGSLYVIESVRPNTKWRYGNVLLRKKLDDGTLAADVERNDRQPQQFNVLGGGGSSPSIHSTGTGYSHRRFERLTEELKARALVDSRRRERYEGMQGYHAELSRAIQKASDASLDTPESARAVEYLRDAIKLLKDAEQIAAGTKKAD